MKRIVIIAAAALLAATSYANAENTLSGAEMDQVTAGVSGFADALGSAAAFGDIVSDSLVRTFATVNLGVSFANSVYPFAVSGSSTLATGQTGLLGAQVGATGSSASVAILGN
jgi:hypothetical protein